MLALKTPEVPRWWELGMSLETSVFTAQAAVEEDPVAADESTLERCGEVTGEEARAEGACSVVLVVGRQHEQATWLDAAALPAAAGVRCKPESSVYAGRPDAVCEAHYLKLTVLFHDLVEKRMPLKKYTGTAVSR